MAVKVLIVEDEPEIAESLAALLGSKGYAATISRDGVEALSKARRLKPEVMLLDIMLPKIGGFEVCRQIKAEKTTRKIKVVMITGLARMGDVETAFLSGADDYIIKPFDSDRLLKKLEKVLSKS
jgi:DNA-binding response OmpR family regulator